MEQAEMYETILVRQSEKLYIFYTGAANITEMARTVCLTLGSTAFCQKNVRTTSKYILLYCKDISEITYDV